MTDLPKSRWLEFSVLALLFLGILQMREIASLISQNSGLMDSHLTQMYDSALRTEKELEDIHSIVSEMDLILYCETNFDSTLCKK